MLRDSMLFNAAHNAFQSTLSNALERSRLMIQSGALAAIVFCTCAKFQWCGKQISNRDFGRGLQGETPDAPLPDVENFSVQSILRGSRTIGQHPYCVVHSDRWWVFLAIWTGHSHGMKSSTCGMSVFGPSPHRLDPNHGRKLAYETTGIWHSMSQHYLGIVGSNGWLGNHNGTETWAAQNKAGTV